MTAVPCLGLCRALPFLSPFFNSLWLQLVPRKTWKILWMRFWISKVKDNPNIILRSSLFQPNIRVGPSLVMLSPCVSHTTQICRNVWVPVPPVTRQVIGCISELCCPGRAECVPALPECLPAGAEGLDHTGVDCAASVEVNTRHSTANLLCTRQEAKERGGTHWRQQHSGRDACEGNTEAGSACLAAETYCCGMFWMPEMFFKRSGSGWICHVSSGTLVNHIGHHRQDILCSKIIKYPLWHLLGLWNCYEAYTKFYWFAPPCLYCKEFLPGPRALGFYSLFWPKTPRSSTVLWLPAWGQ